MSGQFRVSGHTLVREGARHHADGAPVTIYDGLEKDGAWHDPSGHGKCSCGALSERLPSKAARQRWHREHKNEVSS